MEKDAIITICNQFSVVYKPGAEYHEMMRLLSDKLNQMITNDFPSLVQLLYRLDISEVKLKGLLKANPSQNAGVIIADLLVERQVQKIKSRQENSRDKNDISDDEKW